MRQISNSLFVFLLGLSTVFFSMRATAQTGVGHDAFSPSITSFRASDGNEWVVTAYSKGTTSHTVELDRKGGSTSDTRTLTPPSVAAGACDNMDDAQVIAIGGDKLVLVVRAWLANSNDAGVSLNTYTDLPHTIYTQSGIFLCVSTDKGYTWGYYHDDGSWNAGAWKTLKLGTTGGGGVTVSTVEYPRIAYRRGYDNKGYVVWGEKTWTTASTVHAVCGTASVDYTNPAPGTGWCVSSCTVGIVSFSTSEFGDNSSSKADGWVFSDGSGNPYAGSFSGQDHFCPGPEEPSIAIAPSGTFWVAYQQVGYNGWDANTDNVFYDEGGGVLAGYQQADAFIYVATGRFEPSTGTFSLETPVLFHRDEISGFYDASRGYLYNTCLDAGSGTTWGGYAGFGPSIQVVNSNQREWCGCACTMDYTVGLVHAFTTGYDNVGGDPRSWLIFFHGTVPWEEESASTFLSVASPTPSGNDRDFASDFGVHSDAPSFNTWMIERDNPATGSSTSSAVIFRFFPTLKYVTGADGLGRDESSFMMPSFFLLSYMSAYVSNRTYSPSLDSVVCRVAASYDNATFVNTSNYLVDAESAPSSGAPNSLHWGTKLDVCGAAGSYKVHAAWRSLQTSTLKESDGGCIIIRPFVSNYLPGDGQAFPLGSTDVNWNCIADGTSGTSFGPYGLLAMGSEPALTYGAYCKPSITTGGTTYTLRKSPSVSGAGMYTAFYSKTPAAYSIGFFGPSNRRNIAMVGNVAHAVTSTTQTLNREVQTSLQWNYGLDAGGADLTSDWGRQSSNAIAITSDASIASYSRDGKRGQTAWARCYSNHAGEDGIIIDVFEGCASGSNSFAVPGTSTDVLHLIHPVIAPLTRLVPGGSGERYLLGWVVTWTQHDKLYSEVLLRGGSSSTDAALSNEDWGNRFDKFTFTPDPTSNPPSLIIDDEPLITPLHRFERDSYVSTTSNENNHDDIAGSENGSKHEIVVTGNGTVEGATCWATRVTYSLVAPTVGAFLDATSKYGSSPTPGAPGTMEPLPMKPINTPAPGSGIYVGLFERNPSVTVNSAGENLAAWEHKEYWTAASPLCGIYNNWCAIHLARTDQSGHWMPIKDVIKEKVGDYYLSFHPYVLSNPSITAFPKTSVPSGLDPVAAELMYVDGGITLHERRFWESSQGSPSTVDIQDLNDPKGWSFPNGLNAQRSFGAYATGPKWLVTSPPSQPFKYDEYGRTYNAPLNTLATPNHGLTLGIGNSEVDGAVLPTIAVGDYGAYKFGTFDTALGVELYRSEMRVKDSSAVAFVWGKVYVEDSSLGLPKREVRLHNGYPDSTGFASTAAMRDTIFSTEWFNWPVSATISYNRLMLTLARGFAVQQVDTVMVDTTRGDTAGVHTFPMLDTVSVFQVDSSIRPDTSFFAPGLRMNYTVELVHQNGHIDTVERMLYKPMTGSSIAPMTIHIAHAGLFEDTVKLRVRGDFANVPDGDSVVEFARETSLDAYPSLADSTIAIGTGGGIVSPGDTCFAAIGPYPNPTIASGSNVSVLVHYCGTTLPIIAQVYDVVGDPIGSPVTVTSDGQTWDRIPIAIPSTSGAYFVHVNVGGYSTVVSFVVS